ncbi:MAG: glycosyltransferase family 9 protein, partial [Planctomycetota bacterium]
FDLTGRDDLRGLLAQLDDMARIPGNALLSPDSGPVHLAVAVGLPVVCLSGPQDPWRTGPRRGGVAVHAWRGLACAPCLERRCLLSPPDRTCMRNLRVDDVVAAIRTASGRVRPDRSRTA